MIISEDSTQSAINSADSNYGSVLPTISIVIVNYNYGKFLSTAISSCLGQTYPNIETIVVDDGSSDNSKSVIDSFGNRIISILKQNGGHASALNAGVKASSGEIICLLDADDLFLPERLDYIAEFFYSDPAIGWVFTGSAPIDTEKIVLTDIDLLFEQVRAQPNEENLKKVDFRDEIVLGKTPSFAPSTSNLCFSRNVSEKLFPIPEVKGISGIAITDIYVRTLLVGLSAGYVTTKDVGIYRFHDNYYKNLNISKKRRVFGEIYTATGYWMHTNFPEFKKISRKFLSKGFSTYLSSNYSMNESADADCRQMLNNYLKQISLLEQLETYLLIFYYCSRLRFKNLV